MGTASATTGADYDRLSPLTQVKATGGAVHKAFTYGTGGTTKDAGKVLTADCYNYIKIGTTDFTVQAPRGGWLGVLRRHRASRLDARAGSLPRRASGNVFVAIHNEP